MEQVTSSPQEHPYHIVVNGRAAEVTSNVLTFDQLVKIAYPTPPGPNVLYTISYKNAVAPKRDGTLVEGQSVEIKNGTIFSVTHTDKS